MDMLKRFYASKPCRSRARTTISVQVKMAILSNGKWIKIGCESMLACSYIVVHASLIAQRTCYSTLVDSISMDDGLTCMAFTVSFVPNTGNKLFMAACDAHLRLYDFEEALVCFFCIRNVFDDRE